MAGILSRIGDILGANINALLDKAEDPGKMIDQYMRKLSDDLVEVKQETAGVLAEEKRTMRLVEDNQKEVSKFTELAKKALTAGNEDDARVFLVKKKELDETGAGLKAAAATAHDNASKMRQMHDKLVKDINDLNARRQTIKAKAAVAKTQEQVNKLGSAANGAAAAQSAFGRMEDKVNRQLDAANAMAELDSQPQDEAAALEKKYKGAGVDASVNDELEAMKSQLGIS
jgi:phage shock protein A